MIDVVVEYAKNAVPILFEIGRTPLIISNIAILGVSRAIDLDDQGRLAAQKIDSKRTYGMLANKLVIL